MAGGPDFLCVGLQKAGTAWLYDQLQFHPGFWMPPIKELHYLDRPWPDTRGLDAIRKRQGGRRWTVEQGWRALTPRDDAFFEAATAAFGAPLDLERYAGLFAFKGELLSGDVTPAYGTLEPAMVEAVARRFPSLKVVLLLREPVARAWSQLAMMARRGTVAPTTLDDPAAVLAQVAERNVRVRSFPTRVADLWGAAVDPQRLGIFFFDDIVARPQETRAAILAFLGADPQVQGALPADFNRKSAQHKHPMAEPVRQALVAHFREELLACRARFGGPCAAWCARHGIP